MSDEKLPEGQIRLRGNTYSLTNGCEVFVGVPENWSDEPEKENEGGYYIKFTHRDGFQTKVRISEGAYDALINAKSYLDVIRKTKSIVRWTSTAVEETAARMDSVYVESPPRTDG